MANTSDPYKFFLIVENDFNFIFRSLKFKLFIFKSGQICQFKNDNKKPCFQLLF